ncbi:hypothetical protein ACO2WH_28940, partial [Escherichia coli]|uniref:hypothetical protein n=1 Tax=Escherichia coli TaxID=562 RepID=UPI003C07C1E8
LKNQTIIPLLPTQKKIKPQNLNKQADSQKKLKLNPPHKVSGNKNLNKYLIKKAYHQHQNRLVNLKTLPK